MRRQSKTTDANIAVSLRGLEAADLRHLKEPSFWWSGWKKRHWPSEVIRRGLRFYGFDAAKRRLCVLLEVTKGGSFTYRTLADFEEMVKQVTDYWPDRDDPHWKKLPLPSRGNHCTGFAIRWKVVKAVDIPWPNRFPQLGWAHLGAEVEHLTDIDPLESFAEGNRRLRHHITIEREPKLRARAKDLWRTRLGGLRCLVCGFDFEKVYGAIGAEFIEMHHDKPLASTKGPRQTKVIDLKPLCSNCHRMVHRDATRPLSLVELKKDMRLTTGSRRRRR